MNIGDVVREMRESRRMTKADLARAIRKDPSYITRLEGGTYESPRQPTLRALAKAFNCEISDLTGASATIRQPTPYEARPEYRRLIDGLESIDEMDRQRILDFSTWLVEKFSEEEGRKLPELATVYPDDSGRKESLVADAPWLPPGKRGDESRDTGSRDLSTNRRREAEGEEEEDEDRP